MTWFQAHVVKDGLRSIGSGDVTFLVVCFAPIRSLICSGMDSFWTDLLDGERHAVLSVCITYILILAAWSIIGCLRVRRWPHTTGTLIEDDFTFAGSAEDRMQSAKVRYEYTVNGVHFAGKRLSPFYVSATGTKMAKWQKGGILRHGDDRVTVFYNPSRPHKAYLIIPTITTILSLCALYVSAALILWYGL